MTHMIEYKFLYTDFCQQIILDKFMFDFEISELPSILSCGLIHLFSRCIKLSSENSLVNNHLCHTLIG